jgi:dipeptidyl aminopeptidase/acylaminoacyl peptidase
VAGFDKLHDYLSIPRVTALRLSPDGGWLAAAIQTLSADRKKYTTSIWRVDPLGGAPARLTRSAEGEAEPEFLPDGALLFASKRPGPPDGKATADGNGEKPGLWLLPAAGGEARQIELPPGGVGKAVAARDVPAYAFTAAALPGTDGTESDDQRRKARKDSGVTAILHETGRVRFWDHDLGPDQVRLFTARADGAAGPPESADGTGYPVNDPGEPARDLTPDPGRALDEQAFELTPDGSAVLTGWWVSCGNGEERSEIVVIDTATGDRRTLLADSRADFESPRVSPDGSLVLAIRAEHDTYERLGEVTLVVTGLEGAGERRDVLAGFDRRPNEAAWAPDSRAIYFTADDNGRCPVFRVQVDANLQAEVTRITTDDAAYSSLSVAPDGSALYALRATIGEPPAPVGIELAGPGEPRRLQCPGIPVSVPGRVEELETTVPDGTTVRAWLVLPDGASPQSPAPLLLWVHGGPVASWNSWSWRWNPWLAAARGYAVLLPDPALSTGYGQAMLDRGHGQWGGNPYTDVMAITDAAVSRRDIDGERTAMMGGSYGGYMANWIAGHTSRFRAIVSHAGLWALEQMFGTTDGPAWWRREFGDALTQPGRYLANSPHLHVDSIITPMLVIHGDKDYRVPMGEALRLWWDLTGRGKQAKFLYFPDENHWILKPGDVVAWYETVFAFLAEHVLGEKWQRPELL